MSRRFQALMALLVLLVIAVSLLRSRHRILGRSGQVPSGVASSSAFAYSNGLAADQEGNLYLNEQTRNRVLKISTDREVSVVAGNGHVGLSGVGGPADQASLAGPTGIALDPDGNLFIADTGNNVIRRVDAKSHIITTLSGNYFDGEWMGEVAKSTAASPGTYPPISIAADSDENLYLAISHAGGIKRIDFFSGNVTQVVGPGLTGDPSAPVANFGPYWVAVNQRKTLYYSDPERNTVSEANPLQNDVHRLAGGGLCGFAGDGGLAAGALLCFPEAIATSNDQKLFIVDSGNNRIRQVDLQTGIITTVAGNGQIGYTGDGGPAVDASLNSPTGIAVTADGFVYIVDAGNQCIRRLERATGQIMTWVSNRDLATLRP